MNRAEKTLIILKLLSILPMFLLAVDMIWIGATAPRMPAEPMTKVRVQDINWSGRYAQRLDQMVRQGVPNGLIGRLYK